jgi:hypothetical protein
MKDTRNELKHEAAISEQTHRAHPREMEMCQQFMNHMTAGFNEMPRQVTLDEPFQTMLPLATMGYNSLRWSLELLAKGYYSQSNALNRIAWECWLTAMYLFLDSNRLDGWRDRSTRPKPWQMRATVASDLSQQNAVGVRLDRAALDDLYDELSLYSHPNPNSLGILYDFNGDRGYTIRIGAAYDPTLLVVTVHLFCYTALLEMAVLAMLLVSQAQSYIARQDELREQFDRWREDVLGPTQTTQTF